MWWIREGGDSVDRVIVVPDKGMAGEIGRQLLALADSPQDVGWVSWPQAGFHVPRDLANRFHLANQVEESADETTEQPVKRRGRPPKAKPAIGTDEENKEE